MKRAVALGVMALTVAVNLAPVKVEAAGYNTCPQNFNGANVITNSKNCNLSDLSNNLQNLQINENCNLGSLDQIKDYIAQSQKDCNTQSQKDCITNAADALTSNYGNTNNCKPEYNTSAPEVTTPEVTEPEVTTPEVTTPEVTTPEVTTPEVTTPVTQTPVTQTPVKETPTTQTPVDNSTTSSYAEQVVKLVNQERAKEGLAPLSIDKNVEKAATVRAKEIQSSFSHTRPNGSSFATALNESGVSYRGAGENIAWGQKTPENVVTAWMNSPGHRTNIMNANYTKIGVGNLQNSNGTQYWVQLFTY